MREKGGCSNFSRGGSELEHVTESSIAHQSRGEKQRNRSEVVGCMSRSQFTMARK